VPPLGTNGTSDPLFGWKSIHLGRLAGNDGIRNFSGSEVYMQIFPARGEETLRAGSIGSENHPRYPRRVHAPRYIHRASLMHVLTGGGDKS
jgi:hypothetical protein